MQDPLPRGICLHGGVGLKSPCPRPNHREGREHPLWPRTLSLRQRPAHNRLISAAYVEGCLGFFLLFSRIFTCSEWTENPACVAACLFRGRGRHCFCRNRSRLCREGRLVPGQVPPRGRAFIRALPPLSCGSAEVLSCGGSPLRRCGGRAGAES